MRILGVLLLLLTMACKPPVVAPFAEPEPTPLTIQLTPAVAMADSDIKITCVLPRTVGEGAFSFGIVDVFRSSGPIDRLQIIRELRVPCEPFTVFCGYQEVGMKDPIFTSKTVTPVGECR